VTELRPRHLLPAILAAAALHAGGAVLIFRDVPAPGASGAGQGGLEIGMGLAGGAPGTAGADAPPVEAQPAEEVRPTARAAAPPDPARPADPAQPPDAGVEPAPAAAASTSPPRRAEALPKETPDISRPADHEAALLRPAPAMARPAPAAPKPETVPIAEAVPTPVATVGPEPARSAEAAPAGLRADPLDPATGAPAPGSAAAPQSAPPPRTRPRPPEPERVRAARAEPPERDPDRPRREPRSAAPPPAPQTAAASDGRETASSRRGAGGAADTGDAGGSAGAAGAGQTASAGGNPGARRDYMQTIAAILAREKRYPRRARLRRAEGTGHLRFTLDASGRVVAQSLARSTGHDSLDAEIAALLRRAAPLPPIPAEVGRDELEILVPIQFRLR
jgi:protein TonB